jgi:UDP-N-acetylglucosamine--N-acetylmuramyl-(pentapeptide) pyrophosphoryl-undecaprenol N-acetylglucosamine transferase
MKQRPGSAVGTCFAVVTGGGTAGHVLPAIAIMDRLVESGHPVSSLHHVGTTRGIEARLLPPTGFASTRLDVVGLQRSLDWRNLLFLPKLLRATWQAWRLLGRLRPQVVVNVGGYASMPATLAAFLRRRPVVVVSYDQRPGLASRVSARFATAVAAAFPDSPLPRARTTGAPIRRDVIAVDRAAQRQTARDTLGLPEGRFVLTVFGGSLGAQAINTAVVGLLERWEDRRDLCIHHVVGERWVGEMPPSRWSVEGIMYRVIGYEDRMPLLFAASDLMVTRAGASTIAELAATGTPAIIVPWPGAAENHQLDNARTLTDRGAAVLLEQHELDADHLAALIDELRTEPQRLADISQRAYVEGERHRGDSLLRVIEEAAR